MKHVSDDKISHIPPRVVRLAYDDISINIFSWLLPFLPKFLRANVSMQVFADHDSSRNPIDVPREWIWNLPRRTVYFGTSVPTIFKGINSKYSDHYRFMVKQLERRG